MTRSHRLRLALALSVACVLPGCVTLPTPQEQAAAYYGDPIAQQDAERLAVAFLHSHLKDPDSAQYEWRPVQKSYLQDSMIAGGARHYGYVLGGAVNAKNSYGGYTGATAFFFVFLNGSITSAMSEQQTSAGPMLLPVQ